jgi:hypothetical protein
MRRFRFTIGGMLALVVFLAVATAALREATHLWDSGVFTAALSVLLAAVLLAVHRTERRRAYWLGFALFGWSYLVASLVPPVEARLLTSKGLAFVDSKIPGRTVSFVLTLASPTTGTRNTATAVRALALSGGQAPVTTGTWKVTTGRLLSGTSGTTENFIGIGHTLLAVGLAFAGGRLSRWLYARRERPEEVAGGGSPDAVVS